MRSLSVRKLNVWYGAKHALKDINVEIPLQQITAIIGPSGCGKSTLLKSLNRLVELNERAASRARCCWTILIFMTSQPALTEVRSVSAVWRRNRSPCPCRSRPASPTPKPSNW